MNGDQDFLWQHLKGVPAFRALLRAVESRFYQGIEWQRPMLDLGCGDGHFAETTFVGTPPPDVGVDPWAEPLAEANQRQVYRLALQAAGDQLPFADGQFGSVVSNSVLEHIPDVDAVVQEIGRVLRPGGLLLITMPSEHFTGYLSISRVLRRAGFDRAAIAYEGWFNRISRHHHCDSPAVWHQRLAAAGLRTVRWQYYFSPAAHKRLEWGHLFGLPSVVTKWVFGHWVIAPWRSSLQWTKRWLRPAYEEAPQEVGAYVCFFAEKVEGEAPTEPLPASQPLAIEGEEPSLAGTPPALEPPLPEPAGEELASGEPLSEESDSILQKTEAVPRIRSLVWLAVALLLAVVGQVGWDWLARPLQPGTGFVWYVLALLAFAMFIWRSGTTRWTLHLRFKPRQLPRPDWRGQSPRILALFWAFLLSLFAWLLMGKDVQPANSATGALLSWAAGILLVVVALWPGVIEGLMRWEVRRFPNLRRRNPIPETRPAPAVSWGTWLRWEWLALAGLFIVAWLIRAYHLSEIPYVLSGDEASMGREAVRILQGDLGNPFITGWLSHPTLYFYLLSIPVKLFGHTVLAIRFLSPLVGALTVVAVYLFARPAWGRGVALTASLLLVAYHFHIHYSRLALNNIWDPLFAVVELGLLWQAYQRKDRRLYIVTGLVLGISQYFYMGSRMLLVLSGLVGLYWLARDWRRVWDQRNNFFALFGVALVVALPIVLYSLGHPNDYMARMNQLGIFPSGWLAREIEITGRSQGALLWEQFWKSALAFNYTIDPTFWYRPDIPLLRFWPSIFFVFGAALALWRSRRTPDFILVVWVAATIFFGGFMLENPPSSQRYVIAAPAVCVLVALALNWLAERMQRLLGGRRVAWTAGVLLVALWFAGGDLSFYFGEYTPNNDFGGINTEIASRISDYLLDLGPEWRTYFMGPPRMGISDQNGFPTVPFLAPDVQRWDIHEPLTVLDQLPDLHAPAVFLFLPERASELETIKVRCPEGTEKVFPGRFDRILFVSYELLDGTSCGLD